MKVSDKLIKVNLDQVLIVKSHFDTEAKFRIESRSEYLIQQGNRREWNRFFYCLFQVS